MRSALLSSSRPHPAESSEDVPRCCPLPRRPRCPPRRRRARPRPPRAVAPPADPLLRRVVPLARHHQGPHRGRPQVLREGRLDQGCPDRVVHQRPRPRLARRRRGCHGHRGGVCDRDPRRGCRPHHHRWRGDRLHLQVARGALSVSSSRDRVL